MKKKTQTFENSTASNIKHFLKIFFAGQITGKLRKMHYVLNTSCNTES